MTKSSVKIGDGWDAYCVTAAKAHVLRTAATLLEQAGTRKAPGDKVIAWQAQVHQALEQVQPDSKTPAWFNTEWEEPGFTAFLRACFKLSAEDAAAVVERVKFNARTLRGQLELDLSEKESPS